MEQANIPKTPATPERHDVYNTENFPNFICHHANWDIYTNARGWCAAIPTKDAAAIGCRASHFGDRAYVKITLPAEYAAWEQLQRQVSNVSLQFHVSYLTKAMASRTTVVEADSAYAARKVVSARSDCDSILECRVLPDETTQVGDAS
jgi:hypothetical protein